MDNRLFNANILAQLEAPGGKEKLAQSGRELIKDHIEETGFARKFLTPKPPTSPLQVSVSGTETVHVVVELPPNASAMVVNFGDRTAARLVRGEKAAVAFHSVMTNVYTINEANLRSYSNPILQMVEEKIPAAIEAVEDRTFVTYCEAACQAVQLEANGGVPTALNSVSIAAGAVEDGVVKGELARVAAITGSAVPLPIQRPDIVRLKNLFATNRQLRAESLLCCESDLNNVLQWTIDDLGSQLTGETLRDGYKVPTIFNTRIVTTLKTRVLRPGNMYAFSAEDTLGRFYTLEGVKFWMDKRIRDIEFCAWEDIGMSVINIRGVAKLELYPCDANPVTNVDGLLADVTVADEGDLTVTNNRVAAGIYEPVVQQF